MSATKRYRGDSSASESAESSARPPTKLPWASSGAGFGRSSIVPDTPSVTRQDLQRGVPQDPRQRLQDSSHRPVRPAQASLSFAGNTITAGRDVNIAIRENTSASILHQLKTDLKPVAAAYDSAMPSATRRETCFEGTRTQVLKEIGDWMHGRGPTRAPIYILDGVAGIGKSTIAQTIAKQAAEDGILGASFFFRRDEDDKNKGAHLFPTIAYQLACQNTEMAQQILAAVKAQPDINQKDIYLQFFALVLNPLSSITPVVAPRVIVIDALDECDQEDAKSILTLLTHHIINIPNIKFFIASRPEFHITVILDHNTLHERFYLHDIETSIVESDIRLYLDFHLSQNQVGKAFPHIKPPWQPTSDEKQKLYGICGTLFIIASTATKFILNNKRPKASPARLCARLLEGVNPTDYSGSRRMDVLDRTYVQILRLALLDCGGDDNDSETDGWTTDYQSVVGAIIILQHPLSCRSLAELLGLEEEDIEGTLVHLHSLVAPSSHGRVFRVYHKSFPDFITSRGRIQKALESVGLGSDEVQQAISKLLIEPDMHHRNMTKRCFAIMRIDLKQNMCGLDPLDWYKDRSEIELAFKSHPILDHVSYACLHWVSHLVLGRLDESIEDSLYHWASCQLLPWFETLAIIKRIDAAFHILEQANSVIKMKRSLVNNKQPLEQVEISLSASFPSTGAPSPPSEDHHAGSGMMEVANLLFDALRFTQKNAPLLDLSPMHVYTSCILFAPINTSISRIFGGANHLRIISGAENHWNPMIATMFGHTGPLTCIAFSPDASQLASGSIDRTVRLWDAKSGSHISTLCDHANNEIKYIAFSADGLQLVSATAFDDNICLWDAKSGSRISSIYNNGTRGYDRTFALDGSRLVSGSNLNDELRLWNYAQAGSTLSTLSHPPKYLSSAAISPDGTCLAAAFYSDSEPITVWNVESGLQVSTLFAPDKHIVGCIALSPDNLRLAAGCSQPGLNDSNVCLWNTESGLRTHAIYHRSSAMSCITFSPDGSMLASGSYDGAIRLWNSSLGSLISTLQGHSEVVTCIAFLRDGSKLASGSEDKTIRLWDTKLGPHISPNHGDVQRGKLLFIAFSPDGSRLASSSYHDSKVRLWDIKSGLHISTLHGRNSSGIKCIAFSPDGLKLASGSYYDGSVQVWDAQSGSQVSTFHGHSGGVRCTVFAADGSKLASGSDDTSVRIWDAESGLQIFTLRGHSDTVIFITFSPDGSHLASGSDDKTICLWDTKSGSRISTLPHHPDGVQCLAYSLDGSRLASAFCSKSTLMLWDANHSCPQMTTLPLSSQRILGFTFIAPKQSLVASGRKAIFHMNPSHLLLLVKRLHAPHLYGLVVSSDIHSGSRLHTVPVCWFPTDSEPSTFALNSTQSLVAVGCENGRIFILDLSLLILP